MLRWLHVIVFIVLAIAVMGQSKQKITVEGHAIQGQNETEEEAIRRAFLDAQWKATRQAGEYVQVEEILVDYDIDEKTKSEYISSVNVVSPTVLRELTDSVHKTYDQEKEAMRFKVIVTYEFDRDEMEKKFRSFISAYKSQKLDVINELIIQYSRRLDMLDSLLERGETETERYISLFTEASGIYNIISRDLEIRGNEISRIIEK